MTDGFSTRTPQQALAALLDLQAPKRLLLIGAEAFSALQAFQEAHPDTQIAHARPGPLPAALPAKTHSVSVQAARVTVAPSPRTAPPASIALNFELRRVPRETFAVRRPVMVLPL